MPTDEAAGESGPLAPGTTAPDFSLPSDVEGGTTALREFRGRPLVLAFYPADWSPVCGDQVVELNAVLPETERRGAALAGVSVDGPWSHAAYAETRGLTFPLLADFEPKGAVARAYGVYRTRDGFANRALFVVDGGGAIRWSEMVDPWVNPGTEGVLAALDRLRGGAGARTSE